MPTYIKHSIAHFHKDSLLRNSVYLMLATGVLAAFGFFFWLISAKFLSPQTLGIATTLVSVMNLIAVLSLLGFDTSLVRFLSRSNRQNEKLNTSMALVTTCALILSATFVLLVPHISPRLDIVEQPIFALLFVVFCATTALNMLTDAAFLAYRQTKFSLIVAGSLSGVKVLLPFFFVRWGAFGIFSALAISQTFGLALSISVLVFKFGFRPSLTINTDIIKRVWQYSLGNYAAGILNLLPLTLLPVIITNNLGTKEAAYFYIVMMMGNLLYMIPTATTRSLFAEGSHDGATVVDNLRRSVRIIAALLFPAMLVLLVGGKYLLLLFGTSYSTEGVSFLYLITLSSIVVGGFSLYSSLFRITHGTAELVVANVCYTTGVIVCTMLLLPMGLFGVGIAWILGNAFAFVVSFMLYRRSQTKPSLEQTLEISGIPM